MKHLKLEALARIVDEPASPEERAHLAGCPACAAELDALREQSRRLAALPVIAPPGEDWRALEATLRDEGLIRPEVPPMVASGPRQPRGAWMRAAAGLLLFVGGAAFGAAMTGEPAGGPAPLPTPASNAAGDPMPTGPVTLEEAEELVRLTQSWHLDALFLYRDRLDSLSDVPVSSDPVGRFLALEQLLAVAEAAVREAPADPFLNGLLVSTVAERQAAIEGLSLASLELR